MPPWEWRKIRKLGVNRYDPRSPASTMNWDVIDLPFKPLR